MRESARGPQIPDGSWIQEDLSEVLASERYEAEDDLYKKGEGHFFGPTFEARLALYPEHKTLEYEDPNVYVVFKKPSRLLIADDVLFVSTRNGDHWTHASLGRNGMFGMVSQIALPLPDDDRLEPVDRRSIEGRLGSESGEEHDPDTGMERSQPGGSALATESSKEKQKPFPTIGNVNRSPYYRPADEHRHAYLRFVLDEHDEAGQIIPHEVYSTKQNAERIVRLELQAGERVKVNGVEHQTEQRDPQGKPLMDADGKPLLKATIYAYGVSRLPNSS